MSTPTATPLFRVMAGLLDGMTRLLRWRWSTHGLEHVPRVGGAVITWNHHSHLDFLAVACDIWLEIRRPVKFLVAERFFRWPGVGWLLRTVGFIPVRAGRGGDAYEAAAEALTDGHLVLVAPEGRIAPPAGPLLPFRTGAARLAHQTGVPLIPSAGRGTERVLTVGHVDLRAAWRLAVDVRFGPPVPTSGDAEATTTALRLATEELLAAVG